MRKTFKVESFIKKSLFVAMAQWVKMLPTEPNDLSPISRMYSVE